MSDFAETLKGIFSSGIKAVNHAASVVAEATTYKLNEMDNIARRREAISELGEKIYGMYQAGVELPEDALPLLSELSALDEGLSTIRSEHAAKKEADAQQRAADRAARKEERAAAKLAHEEAMAKAEAEAQEIEDAIEQAEAVKAEVEEIEAEAAALEAEITENVAEAEYTAVETPAEFEEAPVIEVEAPADEEETEEEPPVLTL